MTPLSVILEKGIIPPNALFEKLNPAIDAEYLRVEVRTRYSLPLTLRPLTLTTVILEGS